MADTPTSPSEDESKKSPKGSRLPKLRIRSVSAESNNEVPWHVGGCYTVGRQGVSLYSGPDLQQKIGSVEAGENVILLEVQADSQPKVAFALPSPAGDPGWVSLDAADSSKSRKTPLRQPRLPGSWEIAARYTVVLPATLRRSVRLGSDVITEAKPGDEVLLLELGVNEGDEIEKPRLRARVRLPDETVGWMSPQTVDGDRLLDSANLYGQAAVEHHRKSLQHKPKPTTPSKPGRIWSCGLLGSKATPEESVSLKSNMDPGGPRRSYTAETEEPPWKAGGRYQVLEPAVVRAEASLASKKSGKLSAGDIVSVKEVQLVECASLGQCPCALIHGPDEGVTGWIRCAAVIDGHDLVDTRDQNEYQLVMEKLRSCPDFDDAAAEGKEDGEEAGEDQEIPQKPDLAQQDMRVTVKAKRRWEPACMEGCFHVMSVGWTLSPPQGPPSPAKAPPPPAKAPAAD